jgi:hypothetical protein
MQKKVSLLRKLSLILGITALLLGLIPLSALGGVGVVSAEGEEPPVEEPEVVEEPEELEEPEDEGELEFSLQAAIGSDPDVADELPDFGNNYNNGDCVLNDSCAVDEPVTNPNDYTDMGTYGKKDYVLPIIDGSTANIVAIKEGNTWYFFKQGSGVTCVGTSFCVEFDGSGNVSIHSYNKNGPNYSGFNLIHFWLGESPDPGGGGGPGPQDPPPGGGGQLIPVTGADLSGVSAAELQLMLRSLGALFLGSNFVIGGIAKRKQQ